MDPNYNENSILDSVKKGLGITTEYTDFDPDIIININAAFSILYQLGVGPAGGFKITDNTSVWSEFVDDAHLEFVKTYTIQKVKQFFDPPQTGPLVTALDNTLKELEWRINVAVDPKPKKGGI